MSALRTWILASRPKTLPAAIVPVLMGAAIAHGDGVFMPSITLAVLLAALWIQIGTNFANDYFDFVHGADTEARVGPPRGTQAGLVSLRGMRMAMVVAFAASAACATIIVRHAGWPIAVIGLLSITAGILYTAGPVPLGYLGLGDVLVFVFFGLIAVGGTYFAQARSVSLVSVAAGVAPGLLATAILVVNNLRDRETDRQSDKKTLAVRFGARFARGEYVVCFAGAALVPVVLCAVTRAHGWSLLALLALPVGIPALRSVLRGDEGESLNHVLGVTGKVMFLYGVLFSVGWIV